MSRRSEVPTATAPPAQRAAESIASRAAESPTQRAAESMAERVAEPCLHCGHPVPVRLMGCKGGHCPNCRYPYPHGDCSD